MPQGHFTTSAAKAEMDAILQGLVQIDTTNPPGGEKALALHIMALLRQNGAGDAQMTLLDHGGGRASLRVVLAGAAGAPQVGFAGHLDVVPAGSAAAWAHPPFAGHLQNGVLTGRGAADMKGGLTAMLALCLYHLRRGQQGHTPPAGLHFFFTADEESGGTGIAAMQQAGWFGALGFLFICEPTGCRAGLCEKGMLWLECTATGRTSHASMAHTGVNAAALGFAFLQAAEARVAALAPQHPLLGRNTLTLTMVHAGVKINVVPDEAVFSLDIRTVPGAASTPDAVEALLGEDAARFAAQHGELGLCLRRLGARPALESPAHPAVHWLEQQCRAASGQGPVGLPFFTDGALVLPHHPRLPFLILGPGQPAQCHAPGEHIHMEEVYRAAGLYQAFVQQAIHMI